MQFLQIERFQELYFLEIKTSLQITTIGKVLLDNYCEANWIVKDLRGINDFAGGGNATYILAEGPDAILSHEYLDLPEVTINRSVLASLLEDFYNLAIKKTPIIYVIEENGKFTVTDKPTAEIEEYLKNPKA